MRKPNVNANNPSGENDFDTFLDDATHKVKEMWQGCQGRPLTMDELYALNDLLTAFFADKRS